MKPEDQNERNKACNRLFISAKYYFGDTEGSRHRMNSRMETWQTRKGRAAQCSEEVREALGIKNVTKWNEFINVWFREAGIVRHYGCSFYHAEREDIQETRDRLNRMQEDRTRQARAEVEGLTPEDTPPSNPSNAHLRIDDVDTDAMERYLKTAEEAIKQRDEALATVKKVQAELEQARKTSSKGPLEIVFKREGKKPVVIKQAHYCLPQLEARIRLGIHVYLVGPAGSGKTTAAEQVAQGLGLKFGFMSVGPQTTKTDILGYMNASGHYVTTEFRERFENGGVFLFDEIDAGNPGVLTCINAALANGWAAFPDGMVKRHEDFRCIAAGNTFGTGPDRQYVGRQEMDAASIDRFNFLEWPYDEGLELAIAKSIDSKIADEWVGFVQRVRKAVATCSIRHVVSPRASINGTKMLSAGIDRDSVLATQLWKSLKPAEVQKIMSHVS